jgi:hypothetical protein
VNYGFHPEALEEYEAAARYYSQQQPGLDLHFIGIDGPGVKPEAKGRIKLILEH